MNKFTAVALTLASTLIVGTSIAAASGEYCTSAPRSQWRSIDDVRVAVEALGYKNVRKIEIDDSCFEAYAFDKDGRRVEVYVDPVSLKVVRVKNKS